MDALFFNHLLFMGSHRGEVVLRSDGVHILGKTPDLTSFVPSSSSTLIPLAVPAVRVTPFSGQGWETKLPALGYKPAESLSYMELATSDGGAPSPAGVAISAVRLPDEAKTFAFVQSQGFATGDAEIDGWWQAYFLEQALANFQRPEQRFLIAQLDNLPAGIMLTISSGDVIGIYAVATLPNLRRHGVSAALLERVRRDARESRIILQAVTGSYAEAYYGKLGFVTRYITPVWRLDNGV